MNKENVPRETRIYFILPKYQADMRIFQAYNEISIEIDNFGMWAEMTEETHEQWKEIKKFLRFKEAYS